MPDAPTATIPIEAINLFIVVYRLHPRSSASCKSIGFYPKSIQSVNHSSDIILIFLRCFKPSVPVRFAGNFRHGPPR
jgi:hypothetical protein